DVLEARIDDPKQLDQAQELHLLADKDQFYLAVYRPTGGNGNRFGGQGQGPWTNLSPGLRSLRVSGMVYAFDRATGQMNWRSAEPVLNQMLVLDQFKELPILLFTAQSMRVVPLGNRVNQQLVAAVLSIDKRTGKILFTSNPRRNHVPQFHAVHADPRTG